MLFNKELTRARQRSVVACLFIGIVRDPMVPVDVEELLLAGAGVDSLAQSVPGVVGGRSAVGEVEGVRRELVLKPGDVSRRGGDRWVRGGGGGSGDGCGGVGGGRWRAGAEVP